MSFLRTLVSSSRALVVGAKDLARLRDIARVFLTHGFGWAVRSLKIRRELQLDGELESDALNRAALADSHTGERLVKAFTELGPTWVKFGQILSTRPDVLPKAVIEPLQTLQDKVEAIPFHEIEEQLKRNLGEDWRAHFASIDETPLASASIAQVHKATLLTGETVVLKVQRPGIRDKIESDLHILATAAGYIEEAFEEAHAMDLRGIVRDFSKSLSQELDYRIEAQNVETFRRNFEDDAGVYLPVLYRSLSTAQVLCMEFIGGKKFTEILAEGGEMNSLVTAYFNMAYKMLFVDGFFHGDLHPGNVFQMPDGRLALIDCGMVGRLSPTRKDKVVDIIWAIVNQDLESVARTVFELAIPQGPVDYAAFEADAIAIAEQYLVGVPISQVEIGALFSDLVRGASRHNVRMPTDFTMMFKAIATTEGLAKAIAPDVDPIELAKPFVTKMVMERYTPERLRQQALSDLQLLSGMVRAMPRALPTLVNNLNKGALRIGVSDETLERQEQAAERRLTRVMHGSFALGALLCGTLCLMVPGLPIAVAGLPWLTVILWSFSVLYGLSTIRIRPW